MTPEEFLALPDGLARRLIYDALHERLERLPPPRAPLPPKFDARIGRKGGFTWASEMLVESLNWWAEKKRESVQSGSEFAERDAKTLEALERWIAWRDCCPTDTWSGTRGNTKVRAASPSREPELHPWDQRGPSRLDVRPEDREQPTAGGGYEDRDYGGSDDDEIPF